jgi:C1A family cysteine protease
LIEEFFVKYLGLSVPENVTNQNSLNLTEIDQLEIPDSFDWREKNILSEIYDQANCNSSCQSCWAFSTISTLEALYKIKKNVSIKLSAQNLIDCAYKKIDNRDTCITGGWMGIGIFYHTIYKYNDKSLINNLFII